MRLLPKSKPKLMEEAFLPRIEGITKTMFDMLGEMLQNSQMMQKVDIKNVSDFYKIAAGMSALTKAVVEIERWQMEKTRRIEDISGTMKAELTDLLAQRPDLYAEMLPLIEQAEANMVKEYTAQEDTMPPIDVN